MPGNCPYDLYKKEWVTTQELKANMFLVHGIGEHLGRYEDFAAFFNRHGISVYGFDLPGHGKSSQARGHIPSFDRLNDCIELELNKLRAAAPGLPLFLYGHSLGGLIVLNYLFSRKPADLKVIASAPGLKNKLDVPGWKMTMAKIMNRIMPGAAFSTGMDKNQISRVASVVAKYASDPLVHDKASAYLALTSINLGREILQNVKSSPVPLLIIQGSEDGLVSAQDNISFGRRLSGDVTVKEWPGLYHEVHNEPEKEAVLTDVLGWMTQYF